MNLKITLINVIFQKIGFNSYKFHTFFIFQVGLRQLDMSLLYQLLSLHESIQEFKQITQERPTLCVERNKTQANRAIADWAGGDTSAEDTDDYYGIPTRRPNPYLHPVPENFSHNLSPSSSESSLEFGNI